MTEKKEIKEDELEYNDDGELVPKLYVGAFVRNPNGASKTLPDPRQAPCWRFYMNSVIAGQPNAKRAAIQAGYAPNTAANITNLHWFKQKLAKIKRHDMLNKAERNLDKILDLVYERIAENGESEVDTNILKVVSDVSKTIATTLGKDEGYSTKSEVQQNQTGEIIVRNVNYNLTEPVDEPLQVENEAIEPELLNEKEHN